MLHRRLASIFKVKRRKSQLSKLEVGYTLAYTIQHLKRMLRALEAELREELRRTRHLRPRQVGAPYVVPDPVAEAARDAAIELFAGLRTGRYSIGDLERACAQAARPE
jgi:hypothetical protein